MSELALVLIVLMMVVCPLVMGAMMLMMWRGMRHGTHQHTQRREDASRDA